MKHADFIKQHHRSAATFTLADLCTQLNKERFDVAPLDVGADGPSVNSV